MTIEGPELGNPGGGDKDELLSLSLFSVERREWSRLWSWRVEGEAGGFATRWSEEEVEEEGRRWRRRANQYSGRWRVLGSSLSYGRREIWGIALSLS